jgi:hypothetical protein
LIHNDLENKNYNPVSPDKKKKSRKTLILRDFFFLPGDNRKNLYNFGISGSVNTGLCVFRLSPGKKKKSRKINVLRDFFFLSGETGL